MNQDAPTFQVSNPLLLFLDCIPAVLSMTVSAKIESTSENLALGFSIFMVLTSIYLFIKGIRPINVTLLPTGLQVGKMEFTKKQIVHVELNERYRRIDIHTTDAKRPAIYYLKRKGDIPYVRQFLQTWSKRTNVTIQIKDSWS